MHTLEFIYASMLGSETALLRPKEQPALWCEWKSSSAIAERPRCRVGQLWPKWTTILQY